MLLPKFGANCFLEHGVYLRTFAWKIKPRCHGYV